jgi:hypothetical protein
MNTLPFVSPLYLGKYLEVGRELENVTHLFTSIKSLSPTNNGDV